MTDYLSDTDRLTLRNTLLADPDLQELDVIDAALATAISHVLSPVVAKMLAEERTVKVVFDVYIGMGNDDERIDQTTATIERYLYADWAIKHTRYDENERRLVITVVGTFPAGDDARIEYLTDYQQNRLRSGMYPVSDAKRV